MTILVVSDVLELGQRDILLEEEATPYVRQYTLEKDIPQPFIKTHQEAKGLARSKDEGYPKQQALQGADGSHLYNNEEGKNVYHEFLSKAVKTKFPGGK